MFGYFCRRCFISMSALTVSKAWSNQYSLNVAMLVGWFRRSVEPTFLCLCCRWKADLGGCEICRVQTNRFPWLFAVRGRKIAWFFARTAKALGDICYSYRPLIEAEPGFPGAGLFCSGHTLVLFPSCRQTFLPFFHVCSY